LAIAAMKVITIKAQIVAPVVTGYVVAMSASMFLSLASFPAGLSEHPT
jgi:hypothetical protein